MKNEKKKSMFGAWMVLFMSIVMLFTACEKLDEDLSTKSDSKRTTTTSYVQNKNREVTGPTTEVCSWEIVTDNNGEKTVKKYAYTLPRELRAKPEYKKYVNSSAYQHKKNNPIERGEVIEDHTEDGGIAKFYKRTDILSSLKVNGYETDDITMPYEFEHGKLVFDNGVVQVTFDFEEIQFSEKNTEVKSITSPESGKDAARLTNTIATKYIGYSQDASESVILLTQKGVTIVDHGFVTDECYEVPENGKVTAYFLHRTTKSDGTHVDKKIQVSDTRSSEEKVWSSIEANNNQTTGSATKSQTGSSDKSTTKDDVTVKWKRYSYELKSPVTLAGSTQSNLILTEEPEGWTAEYNGDTYTIPRPNYTVSCDKGAVSGGSESGGYKVYDYLSKFSYTRTNNTKSLNGKGTIKVKVDETPTFFPKEWGKLKRIKQTVANNPNHNSFVYTWLLEFEENVKLPVVVAPGSITPDWNFSYAEVTTVSDYNGGTYDKATGKWICTTASDKPNQMVWTRNSKEKANKDYQIARNQNWDEGHTVDGHPSTQTSRYQLTVSSDGRLTAKDTYTGKAMGSWK